MSDWEKEFYRRLRVVCEIPDDATNVEVGSEREGAIMTEVTYDPGYMVTTVTWMTGPDHRRNSHSRVFSDMGELIREMDKVE